MRTCPACLSENLDGILTCTECLSPLPKLPPAGQPAPPPEPWLGPYVYKMVQVSEHVSAQKETLKENEAASYLQELVNKHAKQGWEFFRVDEIFLSISSPAAFGERSFSAPIKTYIVTFRRPPEPVPSR